MVSRKEQKIRKAKKLITESTLTLLLIMFLVGSLAVNAILIYERFWGGQGNIRGIGIELYFDPELTQSTEDIVYDWGTFDTSQQSKSVTIYAFNNGGKPVWLDFREVLWIPASAADLYTFTWDYNGLDVGINETRAIVFTLTLTTDQDLIPVQLDWQNEIAVIAEDFDSTS